ncbi:sugar ABC transporter ATP-binding protein [Leucobacter sp. CSA1]|uniref:Sugar ABC transporter ATP-binding protein n=1 Tax=Leucobacter chromiisoli TaxID=2796471 RepID=A0A934Q854_9MICO|nr:ATP-binding cassette domain-containing protein [Leucobacter chromiisoli]MBK0419576.1 sugar ABC transporter ATP-binding protein [Leucobacter chromiisoli]
MSAGRRSGLPAADPAAGAPAIIEARGVGKRFDGVRALSGVDCVVRAGEVTAVLGDNGAGKSTLIGLLSGMHAPDSGELVVDGEVTRFASPRDARARGIATVHQDLALAPLMPVWRNFFLGAEPTRRGLLRAAECRRVAVAELARFGIELRDPDQPVGTLSGGERQCVAIARAAYFGARALILDEPTAALGVHQSGIVLRQIVRARERGLGVVLITHNPAHAYAVGDRFVLLRRGETFAHRLRDEVTPEELAKLMAGGAELDELYREVSELRADRAGRMAP